MSRGAGTENSRSGPLGAKNPLFFPPLKKWKKKRERGHGGQSQSQSRRLIIASETFVSNAGKKQFSPSPQIYFRLKRIQTQRGVPTTEIVRALKFISIASLKCLLLCSLCEENEKKYKFQIRYTRAYEEKRLDSSEHRSFS